MLNLLFGYYRLSLDLLITLFTLNGLCEQKSLTGFKERRGLSIYI